MVSVEIEKWILFSECILEGCQRCPNEDCLNGTELANSVSRGSKGQVVSDTIQPQTDRDKTWENFWVKKGMPMDLVCFWRNHDWSWEAAKSNEDLIRCVDSQGFLMDGLSLRWKFQELSLGLKLFWMSDYLALSCGWMELGCSFLLRLYC